MTIAEFDMSDGLPPMVIQKLNYNFRQQGGGSALGGSRAAVIIQENSYYENLPDKPSIEDVILVQNKDFPDLGIFRTDDQGFSVPDDYSLTTQEINDLWANALPLGG